MFAFVRAQLRRWRRLRGPSSPRRFERPPAGGDGSVSSLNWRRISVMRPQINIYTLVTSPPPLLLVSTVTLVSSSTLWRLSSLERSFLPEDLQPRTSPAGTQDRRSPSEAQRGRAFITPRPLAASSPPFVSCESPLFVPSQRHERTHQTSRSSSTRNYADLPPSSTATSFQL